jgi:hypothetical protein
MPNDKEKKFSMPPVIKGFHGIKTTHLKGLEILCGFFLNLLTLTARNAQCRQDINDEW